MGNGDNLEEEMADVDCETAAVMKERVATSTRDGYERRNINFMIWFFDNLKKYPNLLETRESIRAMCRKVLREINSGVMNTISIKLEKLNFKVYARFLSTFKKTVKNRNIVGTVVVSDSSVGIRFSPSSYDAYCSALSHIYLECGIDKEKTSKEIWMQLCSYKKGHTETGCKRKETAQPGCNRRQESIALPCV